MIYLLTYDLKRPGQSYASLFKSIKDCGQWWHYLDSTWLVHTNMNATQIWNHVAAHIDVNDRMLIVGITPEYQGWLPADAWAWIKERLGSQPTPPRPDISALLHR